MAKKDSAYQTADGQSYLTKRLVVTKAKAAGRKAAKNAMEVMGYVVVVENNEVVRKFADGTREVVAPIGNAH